MNDHVSFYDSPIGTILLTSTDDALTGLCFSEERTATGFCPTVMDEAKRWLDIYFSGKEPDFTPPLELRTTAFRRKVCRIMLGIPYGKTMSYGEIAAMFGPRMSAQAVGGAVGHNPISLIIPCHRVIGSDGSMTGYGGGLDRKVWLLELERRRND